MNDIYDLLKTAFFFLVAIIVSFVAWFGKRNSDQLEELRKTVVTREELNNTLARLREDRFIQHQENRETLTRIETKIDANEERASKTRHDTQNEVHALGLQMAVLSRRDRTDER